MGGSAVVTNDGRYRYQLQRDLWPQNEQVCLFVMLNPSIADAVQDDPTLRRCKTFAAGWGYGRLEVVNLFSLRATDPQDLYDVPIGDLFGPDHWAHFLAAVEHADYVVCGWGAEAIAAETGATIAKFLNSYGKQPVCLGTTQSGAPRHPLYQKGSTVPTPYSEASA